MLGEAIRQARPPSCVGSTALRSLSTWDPLVAVMGGRWGGNIGFYLTRPARTKPPDTST